MREGGGIPDKAGTIIPINPLVRLRGAQLPSGSDTTVAPGFSREKVANEFVEARESGRQKAIAIVQVKSSSRQPVAVSFARFRGLHITSRELPAEAGSYDLSLPTAAAPGSHFLALRSVPSRYTTGVAQQCSFHVHHPAAQHTGASIVQNV